MTPIRVRGNSFPRALFLFLFYSLPGSYFDLYFFRTFVEKDWASRRWSKSPDKRPVWSGMITLAELVPRKNAHCPIKNDSKRVPRNCFPGALFLPIFSLEPRYCLYFSIFWTFQSILRGQLRIDRGDRFAGTGDGFISDDHMGWGHLPAFSPHCPLNNDSKGVQGNRNDCPVLLIFMET